MECNRDEAVRARDIAENKYAKQDFVGAKKFVHKAQQLFPTLEGLSQMLQVLEVHAVAQIKLGGNEMDWYGILQVDPGADDSTIKKQYRRLALLLHPDKNKAVGAEAAFKLIGEAWGILSDKTKRALHDMKRGVKIKTSHVRVAMESNVQNFQTPYTAPHPPIPTPPQPQHHSSHNSTFWTSCPSCKMQYQYLRTYENYQLQCPKCKNVFLARDIHSTTNSNGASGFGWFEAHRQEFGFNKQPAGAAEFNGATPGHGFVNGSFSVPNQANSAAFFSSAAAAAAAQSKVAAAAAAAAAASSTVPNNLAADVVNQTYAKVKRERVEAEKETKRREKELRRKEKDELRKEKGDLKKAKEAERSRAAMESLMAKRKERAARDESKRKGDARSGRKLKRKKRNSDQEEDEDLEDDDPKAYESVLQEDQSSPVLPRRRSSRAKKNVATYKVDISDDDSDLEDVPGAKRAKSEGEASAEDTVKSEDENGREAGRQRSENGAKGKSLADDSNRVKRGVGANGGEEFDRLRHPMERIKDDQGSTPRKDSHNFVETSKRESKLRDSPSTPHKTRLGKSSQQESPLPVIANHREGEKFPKSEDFREEKSPSKSPRTLRMRVKSPKVPLSSQSMPNEDDQMPQEPVASPIPSAPSTPASEEEASEEADHILVPDPDFHDFDAHRTEKDILQGQIWAIYDDQDGMPRFYGRISRCSIRPFKVSMSWLEHCSSDAELLWTESTGLSVTCGEFKLGKPMVMDQINTFSHVISEKSAGRGPLKVYPKTGEVWAVYRDWDPEKRTGPARATRPNGEANMYTYDVVEILNDFSEGKNLRTTRLYKIGGYKTLFRRQDGVESYRVFPPTELIKISHNVPKQQFSDKDADAYGIPRGSMELDPASTPLDLMNLSDPS